MKKTDFKKLALMGMTGGLLLSSQAPVSAGIVSESETTLAHSCGTNSCSHRSPQGSCNNRTPDSQPNANSCHAQSANKYTADSDKSLSAMNTQKRMTESDLMSQLNDDAKRTYQGLDAEGKALALKMANQDCKGKNDCKGQNSCKTEKNTCAGLGGCKGTSPAPFKDKNTAVKTAAKFMADKRAKANGIKSS